MLVINILFCIVHFFLLGYVELLFPTYFILIGRAPVSKELAVIFFLILLMIHYVVIWLLYKKKRLYNTTYRVLLCIDICGAFVGLSPYVLVLIMGVLDGGLLGEIEYQLKQPHIYIDVALQAILIASRIISMRKMKK